MGRVDDDDDDDDGRGDDDDDDEEEEEEEDEDDGVEDDDSSTTLRASCSPLHCRLIACIKLTKAPLSLYWLLRSRRISSH